MFNKKDMIMCKNLNHSYIFSG